MINNLSQKAKAKLVGIFILTAYLMLTKLFTQNITIVLITDIISGLSVIGIAVLLYPYFKYSGKFFSKSYLALKFVEGTLMIAGGILFLYAPLAHIRDVLYDGMHLFVFIISGFLFYHLLYKTKIVPGFIAIWGLAAIVALTVKSGLSLVGINIMLLDMLLLLIITNEFFLAIWLIIKGFKNP